MAIHMDLQAELKALREENARLKANKGNTGGIKTSAKGCVSVYGLGRFPVSLYPDTWRKLLAMGDDIEAYIEAGLANGTLKSKADAEDEDND